MSYEVQLTESYFPAQSDGAIRKVTLGEQLRETTKRYPEKIALVEIDIDGLTGRSWTYRELLSTSETLALALAGRFTPGERITVWSPNTPEWVIIEFACALAGIVIVTANPALQFRELRYVIEQSGSVALFLVDEYRGNPMREIGIEACDGLGAVREIIDLNDLEKIPNSAEPARSLPTVDCNDPAMIQYTSGATGFPKGAVLSHQSLLNNARFYADRLEVSADHVWANIMPMFHTSGCGMVTLGCVQTGCKMLIVKLFDPNVVCRIIEEHRVSTILGVPTMLVALLEALQKEPVDVSSLKDFSSGGAMVAPELIRNIQRVFSCRFSTLYGQTETSPVITQNFPDDSIDNVCHTIGQPLPQTEVSIRCLESNKVVGLDGVGEICVRAYCNMIGYHDNPEATKDAIDDNGWLHTGDLGTMDARGYVRITGRVKDMIIRGGENMFPTEIENILMEHPNIAEVAVVGIPDKTWGEVIGCFFRTEDSKPISVRILHDFCRDHLSPQKTPTIWCRVDEFPMTGSRKIQKFVIRDQFLDGVYDPLPME
ncbi:MAG: AMP-binding protein [Proteobacteria bacterium]|nr:AMP-binding protein [Pseudomonadota bacterium]